MGWLPDSTRASGSGVPTGPVARLGWRFMVSRTWLSMGSTRRTTKVTAMRKVAMLTEIGASTHRYPLLSRRETSLCSLKRSWQ